MKDPILLNKMWREVEAGRVTASQSGSLTIFKYTQETHIQDLWNDVNRQARGIIFDVDGTVVARPFNKFFNLHERPETNPDNLPWSEGCEVYEKVDGSCGTGYRLNGQWKLATPGSMESDQAIEGTAILNEKMWQEDSACPVDDNWWPRYRLEHLPTDCTPVFEIIYPENRIVVDYHGARELVLLAIFEHDGVEWHPRRVDQIADMCGFRRPKRYNISLREADIPFEDNSEGYVVRFDSGLRVKVKSPKYMRVHRLLNHMSPKGVIELIRGKEYRPILEELPDYLQRDMDDIRACVQMMYNDILTKAYGHHNNLLDALPLGTRKDHALWIQANVPNAECGLVFSLLDGKDITDSVWRLVLERFKTHE